MFRWLQVIFCSFSFGCFAQECFVIDDCEAYHKDGIKGLNVELVEKIIYPDECIGFFYDIKLQAKVIVEIDGKITVVEISGPTDVPIEFEEAVRIGLPLIRGMITPICNGKRQRTFLYLPVRFKSE